MINAVSTDVAALTIGKVIQGLSAGTLFLAILPVSLRSFPNKIRNTFLFMVITGLFGASAVGAYFGAVSLSLDAWRWLYVLNVVSAVLCLAVGYYGLPKSEEHHGEHEPLDKTGVFLFVLTMISLVIPLCNLMQRGSLRMRCGRFCPSPSYWRFCSSSSTSGPRRRSCHSVR